MAKQEIQTKPFLKIKFLEALIESGGNVTRAAKECQLTIWQVFRWRKEDEEFARQWQMALELSTQVLEDEAVRRAMEGEKWITVAANGERVVNVKYSDRLMEFVLKGRLPAKYRERFELVGGQAPPGTSAQSSMVLDVLSKSDRLADEMLSNEMQIEDLGEVQPQMETIPGAPAAPPPAASEAPPAVVEAPPDIEKDDSQ